MNRQILIELWPWAAALAVLCGVFVIVARMSGGTWQPRRLTALHHCESGAVQSLAFVLTLPVLVMVLLFIVQVSQLMIGLMTVNYAAFAAARAASVWTPAAVLDANSRAGYDDDDQNELPPEFSPGVPALLSVESVSSSGSRKLEKVWAAAALACLPIAPSRSTSDAVSGVSYLSRAAGSLRRMYPQFDAASAANLRMPGRLDAKLGYSAENTYVVMQFEDRNSMPVNGTVTYNPIDHPWVTYYPAEVGWQDPITVTVFHDLALLPGAGRMLSKLIARADGRMDTVAPTIRAESGVYKHRIRASATMTNEGIRSVRPFIHPAYQ